ncbi:MAG: hypothetical protein HY049_04700 [Acidobacteria bacterium]|nr:hypothetical protein [Acidobacteriota bacterium]
MSGSGARKISSIRRFGEAPASRRWPLVAGAAVVVAIVAGIFVVRRVVPVAGLPATPGRFERASVRVPDPSLLRSIAVAAFANNSADSKDAWLSQGVPQMITTDLASSPDLRVISSQKLNDLVAMSGKKDIGSLDGATVTELAKWAGAGVVIAGSIFKMDSGYRIDAQASDAASGQVLVASKAEGKNVFELVSKLTADLRAGLTHSGAPPRVTPVQTVAVSEDAYRSFTRGMEDFRRLRYGEAADAFREALAADPSYAPAQMRLGMALWLGGDRPHGLEWIRKASGSSGSLSDRDGRLLAVVSACLDSKDPHLIESRVAEFRKSFPRDSEALLWQAQASADLLGDRLGAVRLLQGILGDESDNLAALSLLSSQLAEIGAPGDAAAILSDYLVRHPADAGTVGRKITIYRKGTEVPIPPAKPVPAPGS